MAAEKSKATFIAPVGIGLALFIAELMGVFYTGGSLNPVCIFSAIVMSAIDLPELLHLLLSFPQQARSFGPDVVLKTFNHYREYPAGLCPNATSAGSISFPPLPLDWI